MPIHVVSPLVSEPSASAKPPPNSRIRSHGRRLAVPQVRMKATGQVGGRSAQSSGLSMGSPLIAFLVGTKNSTKTTNMPTVESEMALEPPSNRFAQPTLDSPCQKYPGF